MVGIGVHAILVDHKEDFINFCQIISYSQLSFLCNIISLHKVTIKLEDFFLISPLHV